VREKPAAIGKGIQKPDHPLMKIPKEFDQ
jgi:hypothetical protein